MKRFSLICLGLGMSVLLGFAQSTKSATVLRHRTKTRPVPSITGEFAANSLVTSSRVRFVFPVTVSAQRGAAGA